MRDEVVEDADEIDRLSIRRLDERDEPLWGSVESGARIVSELDVKGVARRYRIVCRAR